MKKFWISILRFIVVSLLIWLLLKTFHFTMFSKALFWGLPTLVVLIFSQLSLELANTKIIKFIVIPIIIILSSWNVISMTLIPCDKSLDISIVYKIIIGCLNVLSLLRVRPRRWLYQIDIILPSLLIIYSLYWYTSGIFYLYDLIVNH